MPGITKPATITIANIENPPDKKKAKLTAANGDTFYIWKDKLPNYQVGSVYDIQFSTSQFNGHDIRSIESARRSSATPEAFTPKAAGGSNTYRETSAADAERMMVTAFVKAGIQAGSVALNEADLTNAIEDVRAAWRNTFGAPAGGQAQPTAGPAPRRSEMDDDIPFAPEWR